MTRAGSRLSCGGALALALLCLVGPRLLGGSVDFDREIRPILSDNCFACHGPDDGARKAGLRLDLKEPALRPLKRGRAAIVPGSPDQSLLVERIVTMDEDDLMPPPSTHKKLSTAQIEALRRWIAEGADWPEHWAFVTPRRPDPPEVPTRGWSRNPVDRFVAQRLAAEGLTPSPRAPKTTLARRAALDLTGLPPTIEEVDAFLADKRPEAYRQLVDRLLDSPRFGENMARQWLDAVRYADSHGYHIDSQRDIWAYRDWVVRAFNQNKPYDQFTLEQLAGDLLPEATPEQKVATGYVRSNMSTGEGGTIEAEYAAKYAFDRVETTSTTWLGLTLTCARCHTHKYDPITQREYYSLYAFFNQLDEPVMDGNKPNPDPFLKLPSTEQRDRLDWLRQKTPEAETRLRAPDPGLDAAQDNWTRAWHERLAGGWRTLSPVQARSTREPPAQLTVQPDQSLLASGPRPETDAYELDLDLPPGDLAGLRLETLPDPSLPHGGTARADDGQFSLSEIEAELRTTDSEAKPLELRFTQALADAQQAEHGPGRAIDRKADTGWAVGREAAQSPRTALFLLEQPVTIVEGATLRVRLKFETDKAGRALGRFRLSAAQGEDLVHHLTPFRFEPWQLIGPFKTAGLAAGLAEAYPPELGLEFDQSYPGVREPVRWHARADLSDGPTHLLVNELHGVHGAYYLTRRIHARSAGQLEMVLRADDVFKIWVNHQLVAERREPERYPGVKHRFSAPLEPGENRLLIKLVNHQGAKHFAFSAAPAGEEALAADTAAILSVAARPEGAWLERTRAWYRRQHSPEQRQLMDELATWREEASAIEAAIPTTMVAKELATPRDTFLLQRGEYDQPGDRVAPGVPAILPPWPDGAPTNRLGLARWLVRPDHPLTARVTMNRLWQQFFGVGLVKTTEDFGVQGERPSHPELLDWLATEFIRSGWDLKHMARLIVTSATYRQTSAVTPELLARDPENRLLARGPRFRVDGEVLRDSALFLSGLLVEHVGGPSVRPYEPPGLWEAVSFNNAQKYVPDRGDGQYRRSLYTFWKRQSPPPNLLIFDAPTRESCVVKRPRTNTPLQALVVLNDPQFVEASRALAARILTEGGTRPRERLVYGFRTVTGRRPKPDEVEIMLGVLKAQLAEYRKHGEAATALLGVGDFTPTAALDPAELAAWSTVAGLLLNLDEALTKG